VPAQNVFRWLDGRGWLVLAGGGETGDIRAQALGRAAADGGLACISLKGDPNLLEDLEDLGAPSGYLVDLNTEDDQTIHDRLAEAGIIVIDSAASVKEARSLLRGAPIEGIQQAFEHGAVVLAEGITAAAFGGWLLLSGGEVTEGLEWLENALVAAPQLAIPDLATYARPVLLAQPSAIAVGIGQGSALALGPDSEVETWGEKRVTIALGTAYSS
jgi:hypothetical protein